MNSGAHQVDVTVFRPRARDDSHQESVVALGIFDGVHVGHVALLCRCLQLARQSGAAAVALTFAPHPAKVLRPHGAPASIESLPRRLQRFAAVGLDAAWVLTFDAALARMPAADFVHAWLGERLRARAVVVGYDFCFGRDQGGNAALLQQLGARGAGSCLRPFTVHVVDPVQAAPAQVASSSRVRACVAACDFAGAEQVLGRPYVLFGAVEHGLARGRQLGFPTANVRPDAELVPPYGVYAAWVDGPFGRKKAAVSIGVHPTFAAAKQAKIEAYLLDYRGPAFYGATLQLHFVARLRGEHKFADAESLVAQMHRDCDAARRQLGFASEGP